MITVERGGRRVRAPARASRRLRVPPRRRSGVSRTRRSPRPSRRAPSQSAARGTSLRPRPHADEAVAALLEDAAGRRAAPRGACGGGECARTGGTTDRTGRAIPARGRLLEAANSARLAGGVPDGARACSTRPSRRRDDPRTRAGRAPPARCGRRCGSGARARTRQRPARRRGGSASRPIDPGARRSDARRRRRGRASWRRRINDGRWRPRNTRACELAAEPGGRRGGARQRRAGHRAVPARAGLNAGVEPYQGLASTDVALDSPVSAHPAGRTAAHVVRGVRPRLLSPAPQDGQVRALPAALLPPCPTCSPASRSSTSASARLGDRLRGRRRGRRHRARTRTQAQRPRVRARLASARGSRPRRGAPTSAAPTPTRGPSLGDTGMRRPSAAYVRRSARGAARARARPAAEEALRRCSTRARTRSRDRRPRRRRTSSAGPRTSSRSYVRVGSHDEAERGLDRAPTRQAPRSSGHAVGARRRPRAAAGLPRAARDEFEACFDARARAPRASGPRRFDRRAHAAVLRRAPAPRRAADRRTRAGLRQALGVLRRARCARLGRRARAASSPAAVSAWRAARSATGGEAADAPGAADRAAASRVA